MYGKQLDAPLEEVTEMIAILTSAQKYQRELYLLSQRGKVMCPNLLDNSVIGTLYRFINYSIGGYVFENAPNLLIDELQKRKQEMLDTERIDS